MTEVVTEKTISLYKDRKICTFQVNIHYSKPYIKFIFYKKYSIKPLSIKTLNRLGKNKRMRSDPRRFTLVGSKRIAYIRIPNNAKIDAFEVK